MSYKKKKKGVTSEEKRNVLRNWLSGADDLILQSNKKRDLENN